MGRQEWAELWAPVRHQTGLTRRKRQVIAQISEIYIGVCCYTTILLQVAPTIKNKL